MPFMVKKGKIFLRSDSQYLRGEAALRAFFTSTLRYTIKGSLPRPARKHGFKSSSGNAKFKNTCGRHTPPLLFPLRPLESNYAAGKKTDHKKEQ